MWSFWVSDQKHGDLLSQHSSKKSSQARRKVSMRMWLVLFIVLTLSSVANGTLNYNILNDPSRVWDSSLQTITVEGYCFPDHCGRNVAKFNDLTVTLQLFDGTTELNDAPTVRISLFSFEITLKTDTELDHGADNQTI